jgi:hypothetical protein
MPARLRAPAHHHFSMVEGMAPGAIRTLVRPLADYVGQPVNSCLAKGNHRVHFRRPACREIASQRGHCK